MIAIVRRGAARAACLLALLLITSVSALAQEWGAGSDGLAPVPALKQRVTDLTGTLAASDRQALDARLAAWESATGNQLAVLVVPSTKPESIEAYSIRVADAWKIGRKGQDNGALLVVAKDDRKLRIEVGYGFEGVLTDATARRIIAETIAPQFREGRYAQGITRGVEQIIDVVDKGEPLAAKPVRAKSSRTGGGFSLESLLVIVFIVVPVLGGILRRIFGRALGSTVGAGIVGVAAWVVAGTLLIGIIAAVIAFLVILLFGAGGGLTRRGGGVWLPGGGSGGGWGGGGGGGGFSGGGGGFGGGGASGGW